MLLSSSILFPLSKEVIVIGTALCYSHQVCCLLYYLDKMNSEIHMYQFTFKPLHFCFRMCLWFRIWTKILADRRIWRKNGTDRRICIPLFTPLLNGLCERGNTPDLIATLYFGKRKRFVERRCLESPSLPCFMNQLRVERRLRKSKTTNWTKEIKPQTTNPSKIDAICAQNAWELIFMRLSYWINSQMLSLCSAACE